MGAFFLYVFWSALMYSLLAESQSDKWIIVLKRSLSQSHLDDHFSWLSAKAKARHCILHHQWRTLPSSSPSSLSNRTFHSYALSHLDPHFLKELHAHQDIESVQRDNKFQSTAVQYNAPWSLSRLNERRRRRVDENRFEYSRGGHDVDIYVLDSGIDIHHPEFEGRAIKGFQTLNHKQESTLFGHGTHVAGIISSKTFGVAKKARLIDVQVLDSNGEATSSDILHGIQWVLRDIQKRPNRRAVINISFSGPPDPAVDSILSTAVQMGVPVVSASGNDQKNACNFSPSRHPDILTVGATDNRDQMANFSNSGPCVNLFAPGSRIQSLWPEGQTKILDGTSGAAPHVTGVLALLMSESQHAIKTVKELYGLLTLKATRGIIGGLPDHTRNALLFYSPRVFKNEECLSLLESSRSDQPFLYQLIQHC